MQKTASCNKHGFSLVELSIVLVILGLLTGGILGGQALMRAAELRNVSTDISKYETAVMTFRDKYFFLPGDMPNATNFWGISAGATGNDATCFNATSTTTATCNGNGNGLIGKATAPVEYQESFLFWKHLANAGLIEGNYTNTAGSNGTGRQSIPGQNIPASKIANVGFSVVYFNFPLPHLTRHDIENMVNQINIGTQTAWETYGNAFKPEEVWGIDTKLDDGLPATGKIVVWKAGTGSMPDCAATGDTAYKLSYDGVACAITYLPGW